MEVEIKASISRFINGLNNHDLVDIEATVFCPHFRIRGTNLKIWDTAKEFFDDFKAFAHTFSIDSDLIKLVFYFQDFERLVTKKALTT